MKYNFKQLVILIIFFLVFGLHKTFSQDEISPPEEVNQSLTKYNTNDQFIDYNDPKFNYYDSIWTNLTGSNDNENIKQIQEYIQTQYKYIQGSVKEYKDILGINKKWLLEGIPKNYNWIKELTDLEKEFREINNKISKQEQKNKQTKYQIKGIKDELYNIKDKIDILDTNRKEIENIINKVIISEKDDKLSTIPTSILLVGKILMHDTTSAQGKKTLLDKLNSEMTIKAFQKINGNYPFGAYYKPAEGEVTKRIENTQNSGKGIPQELYYKYLQIDNFIPKTIQNIFQIIRLDVYPPTKSEVHKDIENETSSWTEHKSIYEIDIYEVNKELQLVDLKGASQIESLNDMQFKKEEIEYIALQRSITDIMNENYNKLKDSINIDFLSKRDFYERSIQSINNQLEELNVDNKRLKNRKEELNDQLLKDEEELDSLISVQPESKNAYENHIKDKMGWVNKLQIEPPTGMGTLAKLCRMAEETYEATKDNLQLLDNRFTIYQIETSSNSTSDGVNSFVRGAKSSSITYHPNLIGFKILSLDYINDVHNEKYLALNIGYKVNWKIANSLKIECIPDRIIDTVNCIAWSVFQKAPTGLSDYNSRSDDRMKHFRIPEINELLELVNLLKSFKENSGDDILINEDCCNWKSYFEYPILSNTKVENQPLKQYALSVDQDYNHTKEEIYPEEYVCIFLIDINYFSERDCK